MNPFFELETPVVISDVESLLSLNARVRYGLPGQLAQPEDIHDPTVGYHETAGLFRGQLRDWPLVPHAWRSQLQTPKTGSNVESIVRGVHAMFGYRRFCERAQLQNPSFPKLEIERMCIAQHFGVPTPLLDWTHNIFTAIFFSIREFLDAPELADDPRTYIYHIVDERYLETNPPPGDELVTYKKSAYIGPYYADRRIERQRGVFTYHPDPIVGPPKIPVCVYVLEIGLVTRLQMLLEGFGFTHDYFFPDYAGIAAAITRRELPWI